MTENHHVVPPAPIPAVAPDGLEPAHETVLFDPAVHLQLEPPAYVKLLPAAGGRGHDVAFPVPVSTAPGETVHGERLVRTVGGVEVPFTGLAYSAPFRLLSDEGVAALRRVVFANECQHARALPSRAAKAIRGLGYISRFVHDLNYSEEVLAHLSRMAGTPIGPHHMVYRLAATRTLAALRPAASD